MKFVETFQNKLKITIVSFKKWEFEKNSQWANQSHSRNEIIGGVYIIVKRYCSVKNGSSASYVTREIL